MSNLVLGLDGGLANVGYAFGSVTTYGGLIVHRAGVIKTKKSDKKSGVRASDDNLRRAREICAQLFGHCAMEHRGNRYGLTATPGSHRSIAVHLVCAETMSYPRSASVAAKMSLFWGVLAAMTMDVPVAQSSPQAIKKSVCGKANASKLDVERAAKDWCGYEYDGNKGDREHVYDAIAAIHAAKNSDIALAALRGRLIS